MRSNAFLTVVAGLSLSLSLSAVGCGGSDDSDGPGTQADAGPTDDAPDAGPAACRNGFVGVETVAQEAADGVFVSDRSAAQAPFDELSIELYYGLGASDQPHTFAFTGENYANCHTCILILQGCESLGNCAKLFLAQSGSLEVTVNENGDAPGQISETLTNFKAIEVTIDFMTFESTPVPDGECWDIPDYTIDTTSVPRGGLRPAGLRAVGRGTGERRPIKTHP